MVGLRSQARLSHPTCGINSTQNITLPDFEPVLLANINKPDSHTLKVYQAGGGYAAAKSYQFTGTVKASDAGGLTVEKSAKETWQFETSKDTKGTAKVGDKVTVYYKMVATEIEAKPAATATPAKKK